VSSLSRARAAKLSHTGTFLDARQHWRADATLRGLRWVLGLLMLAGIAACGSRAPPASARLTPSPINVTDNTGSTPQGTFSLEVTANRPLAIVTPAALPNGTIGSAYSTSIQASGGTPPYTWVLLSNSSDRLSTTSGSQATPANNAYSIN
jgi:predicted small lipoprotein YifL